MGRKKKNWVPVITERNQWLADDFLKYIGQIYDEYRLKYRDILHYDEDLIQDSIVRTYQTILWNGLNGKINVT